VKESKIFEGRWWIFGTEKPEHFGVLHYSPEKGLRLEVKIAQSFGFAEILQGTDRTDFPNVIQGRDKDDKPISLFCSSRPGLNKSGGLASYEFHPLIAIVGQSVESWSAANYRKVDIRQSLLHRWMGQSRVEQKLTPELVHQIQIVPKPAIEIKLGNEVTLKINSRFHTNPQSGSFEINEEH